MSARALMVAVRETIRAKYGLKENGCKITPNGRPVPSAGRLFYGVHGYESSNNQPEADTAYGASAGFQVTISVRTAHIPFDKLDDVLYDAVLDDQYPERGLYDRCEKLRNLLHMSYPLMDRAGEILRQEMTAEASARNVFVKPPRWLNTYDMGEQSGDWFWGGQPTEMSRAIPAVAIRLSFGQANLYEKLDDLAGYAL